MLNLAASCASTASPDWGRGLTTAASSASASRSAISRTGSFFAQQRRHLVERADDAVPHLRFLAGGFVHVPCAQFLLPRKAFVVGADVREKAEHGLQLPAQVFGRAQALAQGGDGRHGRRAHRLQRFDKFRRPALQGAEKGQGAQAPGNGVVAKPRRVAPGDVQTARGEAGVQVLVPRPARDHLQSREQTFAQGPPRAGAALGQKQG